MKKTDEKCGLSTPEALGILHDEISKVLTEFSPKIPSRWDCMKNILDYKNELSRFSWVSLICAIFIGLTFIVVSFLTEADVYGNLAGHGIVVLAIGALNILLVSWDNHLRLNEIPNRVRSLLSFVKECQQKCVWKAENYPHLCSPFSPCITLQWTYRDHRLVNLPWALLVKGDVIVLRPGQESPGYAVQQDNGTSFLAGGEVYNPPQKHDRIAAPTARVPFKNRRFILNETPLLKNIREVLEASIEKKSGTSYDKQIHLITYRILQNIIIPILIVGTFLLGLLRSIYVGQWIANPHWGVTFMLIPAFIILPIIPLSFPSAWIALHTLGNAKLSAFLQSNSTAPTADPFEDISIDDEKVEDIEAGLKWGQHFFHALLGTQHSLALTRYSNPLHILGSVTALCCVDKKGILSWPNPTAEKIFFLRTVDKSTLTRDTTINDTDSNYERPQSENVPEKSVVDIKPPPPEPELCTRVEVLDLTHDLSCPFKLQFDDTRWSEHMGSLKPIGLAILLNTCNMSTHEHYLQFCSHVTCEALYNEDLVPVTNRRGLQPNCDNEVTNVLPIKKCLCELAKQIGFSDNVKSGYYLREQLCTFRHVQPEHIRKDIKFARSLALATKLKLPFPHMVSVVVTQSSAPKSIQLFSQGTGDIALDSCVDFWDGATLRTLTASDRKKILDFYQRTSLTAYCTAFAYRPLGRPVSSELSKVYMELPADSHALYLKARSPPPIITDVLHQSTDSLFTEDMIEEVNDIEGCFEMQCNQVFLGMVTMQYQAQIEMVQLIEQLERACIRFVHFSKENELRSRVFSEKMGLESGWNCHVSLLSSDATEEDTVEGEVKEEVWDKSHDANAPLLGANLCSLEGSRAMSVSAPCAINTESSRDNQDGSKNKDDEFDLVSQDGWQSLSCLSDSTEQSAPINFDMSNRAKLPRGIDQIRPHLEQVDNVPLLVSLFTDCTPSTTQQMIEIMQEYDEIVCVIGSSANADNSSIFLKANSSVSMEPLYPQVCQKIPVYNGLPESVSPLQLSGHLNSLPCCVTITRQRPVSLFHLIMHARHFMLCLWNCIQFWICSVIALSFLQLLTVMVMLPPLLSAGNILWMCCIVIPLLSISLVHVPTNTQVMLKPVAKKQSTLSSEAAIFVAWCYGIKFLPTLLMIPLIYGITLASYCPSLANLHNTTCTLAYPMPSEPLGGWEMHFYPFVNAQGFATTVLVFHLVIVSVSFVHRERLSWRRNPFKNKPWFLTAILIMFLQCVYFVTITFITSDENPNYDLPISWVAVGLTVFSLPLIFLVNEFIKWQEIKANLRYEKRARLDFGTKLGMNSPF